MGQLISQNTFDKRKKKHLLYCHNFRQHVQSFITHHDLIAPNKKIMISVSGGVDSMALMDLFYALNITFELLHFNHGTRTLENKKEEAMITDLGLKLGVKVNTFHFDLKLSEKNFEQKARELRQNIYKQFLAQGFWVYTAHHIDDSFEWSLMQSFKQSGLKATLGIPLFNNGIIRPFMCVTKKQILRYARACRLNWQEDGSNQNEKFERNFLRLQITSKILEKYPKALAHYVSRSNQKAHALKLHKLKMNGDFSLKKERSNGVLFVSQNFREHKQKIKNQIHVFSNKERGEIDQELNKFIQTQEEILKNQASFPFKGPMHFSGGVRLYLIKDHLLVIREIDCDFYKSLDLKLRSYLKNKPQIPERLILNIFPQIVISFNSRLNKSSKFVHPLLPVTCQWLKNQNISYAFAPLMSAKDRQMKTFNAVILDSSVVGL